VRSGGQSQYVVRKSGVDAVGDDARDDSGARRMGEEKCEYMSTKIGGKGEREGDEEMKRRERGDGQKHEDTYFIPQSSLLSAHRRVLQEEAKSSQRGAVFHRRVWRTYQRYYFAGGEYRPYKWCGGASGWELSSGRDMIGRR
jgi:hypothetical protein